MNKGVNHERERQGPRTKRVDQPTHEIRADKSCSERGCCAAALQKTSPDWNRGEELQEISL